MIRDWRLLLVPIFISVLWGSIYFIYQARQPESKPAPEPNSVQTNPADDTQAKWYVKFSVQDQKSTYYTEAAEAPASASAKGYFIGSGAVHPQYPLNAGGEARTPIIPFETRLYLSRPVEIQGQQYDSLVVNDTGDVYYGLWSNYPYWVDVYAGTANYYTNKAALNAGVDLIDYYWFEPWI